MRAEAESNLGQNVNHSIERRSSRRFQIAVPLLLRWTDIVEHYDGGHCVNIGQGGMFVRSMTAPPLGVEVEIEFVLPAFGGMSRPTRFQCIGRVSRVETSPPVRAFAVSGRLVSEGQSS
jgi:hypothetical protein